MRCCSSHKLFLFAAAMLAPEEAAIARALAEYRARQTADVLAADDPRQ